MVVVGTITKILEKVSGTNEKTGKSWARQPFILTYIEGSYERRAIFNIVGEERITRCNLKEGAMVCVSFCIECYETQKAGWINNVTAWSVRPANFYTDGGYQQRQHGFGHQNRGYRQQPPQYGQQQMYQQPPQQAPVPPYEQGGGAPF